MIFHELTLHNFFSFEDAKFPLHSQGLVTIVGKNVDSSVCGSNGSGKSSLIVDAWCWALYGRTPRGQSGKSVVRRDSTDGCCVSLTFHDGEQYWLVQRYQNHPDQKNNIILCRADDSGWVDETLHDKRDTQKRLDSIIGIPMDVALSSIILGQNSIAFATMSDGDKKGVLETVLQFDTLNRASMKAKAKCGKLRTELHIASGKRDALFEQRESSQIKKFDTEKEQHSWRVKLAERKTHAEIELERINEELMAARVELFNLNQQVTQLKALEKTFAADYHLAVEAHGRARVVVVDLEATHRTLANQFLPQREIDVGEQRASVEYEYELWKKRQESFIQKHTEEVASYQKAIEDSICSTCKQPVPKSSPVFIHLEEFLNKSMVDLASAQESVGEAAKKLKQDIALLERKALENRLMNEKDAKEHDTKVSGVLVDLTAARKEAAKQLKALSPLQDRMTEIKVKQDQLDGDLYDCNRTISALEKVQRDHEVLLESEPEDPYQRSIDLLFTEIKNLTTKIEIHTLERERLDYQLSLHDFWVSGFGKKGIQSFMLDSVTPFLNERIAEYSKIMWQGETHIEFATQKLAADGKTLREDFHVIIDNNSGANEYLGNSAGERERIDLVIALAVQDLVISRQGASFNLCVFDEACRFLDPEGAQAYYRVLQNLARKRDSIFVISHSPELQSLFGQSWTVTKENKVSTLNLSAS